MRLWKGLDDIIFPKPLQWGALYSAGARYSAGEIAWHDLDPSIVRVPNYSGPNHIVRVPAIVRVKSLGTYPHYRGHPTVFWLLVPPLSTKSALKFLRRGGVVVCVLRGKSVSWRTTTILYMIIGREVQPSGLRRHPTNDQL